jgi:hypothetical protein
VRNLGIETIDRSSEDFVKSAAAIVEAAEKQRIIVRIMGAIAFRIHTPALADLHKRLSRLGHSRAEFTDLDLVTYGKFSSKLEPFFAGIGYPADENAKYQVHLWAQRQFYNDKSGHLHIDVFLDKLEMSHTIDFKGRLELDSPTIPLAELLLEKTQIVQINEKDIKDTIILLLGHDIGTDDTDRINGQYIGTLLAADWGLWYTTTMNLDKVRSFSFKYNELSDKEKSEINQKIDILRKYIDDQPKTARWKVRAKIGPSRKWYRDVEERYGTE